MEIKLGKYRGHNWIKTENMYYIGYTYIEDRRIFPEEIDQLLRGKSFNEIASEISKMNGCFSIIYFWKGTIYVCSDKLRLFPIFYSIEKNILTDDIDKIQSKNFDYMNKEVFDIIGYTLGKETLYEQIYQTEGGKCIQISEDNIIKEITYWEYHYNTSQELIENKNEFFDKLNYMYSNIIRRLIDYAAEQTIVLPLSGGSDSRLIAYYLRKLGYKNIITYTYGKKNSKEVYISRRVAEYLGLKWFFIEYDTKSMRKLYQSDETKQLFIYSGQGFTTPIIQEWYAISQLIKRNIVKPGMIVVTGLSGDDICGSRVKKEYIGMEKDPTPQIIKLFANLRSCNKKEYDVIKDKISNCNKNQCCKYCEQYSFQIDNFAIMQKISKFINNAIRTYEIKDLKWYLPFWDDDFLDIWSQVPLQEKAERKLFFEFANKEYGKLMEYAPLCFPKYNKIFKNAIINSLFKFMRIIKTYKNNELNYYGYLGFAKYFVYVLKKRSSNYNYMFAREYLKMLNK